MAPEFLDCPECQARLKNSAGMGPGDSVKCPRCGRVFAVPDDAPGADLPTSAADGPGGEGIRETVHPRDRDLPTSDSGPVRGEGIRETAPPRDRGRPRRPEDEDYDDDYDRPRRAGLATDLSNDYRINFNKWFETAQKHYGDSFGPIIGYFIILQAISFALQLIPFGAGAIAQIFLMPPLQAGLFIVALRQLKGERWDFGMFFSGFEKYGALLGNALLTALCVLPGMIPMFVGLVMMIVSSQGPKKEPDPAAVAIFIGLTLVSMVITAFVATRIATFATFLIIDRDFGAVEALKGSWVLTQNHFWALFGINLVLALINVGGVLACCIGVLFTFPLTLLTQSAGYLYVAGTRPPLPSPRRQRPVEPEDDYDEPR